VSSGIVAVRLPRARCRALRVLLLRRAALTGAMRAHNEESVTVPACVRALRTLRRIVALSTVVTAARGMLCAHPSGGLSTATSLSPQDFRTVFIDVSFGIRKWSQNNASWTSSFSEVRGRRRCSERKRQTWADGRLGDIGRNLVRRGAVPTTCGGATGWLAEKQKP
jgi:hypothetical protein